MTSTKAPSDRSSISQSDDVAGVESALPGVPRASALVRAWTAGNGDNHPLLSAAVPLAAQHRLAAEAHQLVQEGAADDHVVSAAARAINASRIARAVLIEQIDTWAMTRLPEPERTAMLHTESLGQLVDRLAMAWMRWRLLEETAVVAPNPGVRTVEVRAALHQVAELSGAYDDLLTDLAGRRRRLPVWQISAGFAF